MQKGPWGERREFRTQCAKTDSPTAAGEEFGTLDGTGEKSLKVKVNVECLDATPVAAFLVRAEHVSSVREQGTRMSIVRTDPSTR